MKEEKKYCNRKMVVDLLVVAIILSGLMPMGSIATSSLIPSVSIEPESITGLSPGSTFSINVSFNSSTYRLRACKIDLMYNASALTATTVTERDLLGSQTLTEPGSGIKQPGWIHYGIARVSGNTAVPSAGTFITVEFTVNSTASNGTYLLDLSNVTFNDENNAEIPGVEVTDGNAIVGVAPAPTTTPTPTPTPLPAEETPSPTVTPTPTPSETETPSPSLSPTSMPAVTPTASPTPTPTPPGFEAVFAIAGLLAVAYLVLRRR